MSRFRQRCALVLEAQGQEHSDKRQQVENACQHARYEAERAHRKYDAVDPEKAGRHWRRRHGQPLSGRGLTGPPTLSFLSDSAQKACLAILLCRFSLNN